MEKYQPKKYQPIRVATRLAERLATEPPPPRVPHSKMGGPTQSLNGAFPDTDIASSSELPATNCRIQFLDTQHTDSDCDNIDEEPIHPHSSPAILGAVIASIVVLTTILWFSFQWSDAFTGAVGFWKKARDFSVSDGELPYITRRPMVPSSGRGDVHDKIQSTIDPSIRSIVLGTPVDDRSINSSTNLSTVK